MADVAICSSNPIHITVFTGPRILSGFTNLHVFVCDPWANIDIYDYSKQPLHTKYCFRQKFM